MWYLTHENEIRFDNKCLDMTGDTVSRYTKLTTSTCIDNLNARSWTKTVEGQLKHEDTGLCLQMLEDYTNVHMQSCDKNNDLQVWDWSI
jgi:hypothetical protein